MTPKISLIPVIAVTALLLGVSAAFGQSQPAVGNSPDAVERAVLARELASRLDARPYPDAFQRAVLAYQRSSANAYIDAHDRSDTLSTSGRTPTAAAIGDGHERIVQAPAPETVSSSGRDLEWSQIGFGFGVGVLLAVGLGMALRVTRIRDLAH